MKKCFPFLFFALLFFLPRCAVKSKCYQDKECPAPKICIEGKCILECIDKYQCSEGEECINNRCSIVSNKVKAPEFTLIDLNPNSLTYKKEVSLKILLDKPVFIFFASAGCPSCAKKFEGLTDFHKKINSQAETPFNAVAINHSGLEEFVSEFVGNCDLPLLQDTKEAGVYKLYNAEIYNLFIVDFSGYIFVKDNEMNFPDDEENYIKILKALYGKTKDYENIETLEIEEIIEKSDFIEIYDEEDFLKTDPLFYDAEFVEESSQVEDISILEETIKEILPQKLKTVTLKDLNPKSATFNKDVTIPDNFPGQIIVIYFGSATCGFCISQVGLLKQILDELKGEGIDEAVLIVINQKGTDEYAYKFGESTDGPVLQDTEEKNVWNLYGAEYNSLFIVDKSGYLYFIHKPITFPNDSQTVKNEVKLLDKP